jgi:condensin complex subunit 1
MKVEGIRLGAEKVICVSVKHHNQILVAHTNIIQNLQFFDHLPEILAECLHNLAVEFAHTQLGDDILREIASKSFNAQDNKGPRNFARFLVKFAEYAPRSLLKQLSLLLNQLDSEVWQMFDSTDAFLIPFQAYPMRIAIVEVIGHIIQELARSLDSDINSGQTQKQINGLFDLLHERILDVSSYVRTKVLAVLSKVFDIRVPKFPKQRLASTRAAAAALEDKASTVRKAAVSLLIKLLVTHPYGMMQGGMLQHEIWNSEYDAVRKELEKVEGKVGKAVEVQDEDGDEDKDEGEGNEGEGHEGKKTKR